MYLSCISCLDDFKAVGQELEVGVQSVSIHEFFNMYIDMVEQTLMSNRCCLTGTEGGRSCSFNAPLSGEGEKIPFCSSTVHFHTEANSRMNWERKKMEYAI